MYIQYLKNCFSIIRQVIEPDFINDQILSDNTEIIFSTENEDFLEDLGDDDDDESSDSTEPPEMVINYIDFFLINRYHFLFFQFNCRINISRINPF